MRPITLTEFCERYKIKQPSDTRETVFKFRCFQWFIELLQIAFTKQDLARVIPEVAEDAAKDGANWIEPAFDADRYTILRADRSLRLLKRPTKDGYLF